jgi:hypothetical protein
MIQRVALRRNSGRGEEAFLPQAWLPSAIASGIRPARLHPPVIAKSIAFFGLTDLMRNANLVRNQGHSCKFI